MPKHVHDDGLAFHLRAIRAGSLKRRELMTWAVGAGIASLIGCGDDDDDATGDGGAAGGGKGGASGKAGAGGNAGASGKAGAEGNAGASGKAGAGGQVANGNCTDVPEETAGPYPADGSNSASGDGMGGMGMGAPPAGGRGGPPAQGGGGSGGTTGSPAAGGTGGSSSAALINLLTLAGVVRKNIRASFGSSTTTAPGVPMTLKLQLLASNDGCKPLAGAAVYLWHCDRGGNYSLYSSGITSENYLRGVQETDADGTVEFESIFPACYSGRWPHIHYEVYPSLEEATSQPNALAISQIGMLEDTCNEVFASSGYEASVNNFKQVSLDTDNVFSDGYALELPTISGSVSAGYTVSFTAAVTKK